MPIAQFVIFLSNLCPEYLHGSGDGRLGLGLVSSLEMMLKGFCCRSVFFMLYESESSRIQIQQDANFGKLIQRLQIGQKFLLIKLIFVVYYGDFLLYCL